MTTWVPKAKAQRQSTSSSGSVSGRSSCSSVSPEPPKSPKRKIKRYVATIPVCKFYNSYFKTGCVHGDKCSFRHLPQSAFSEYCRKLSIRKPLSTMEIHRFKIAQQHFRENRYQSARKIFGALCSKYPFHHDLNIWLARTHDKVFMETMNSKSLQNIGCATYYYRRAISIEPHNAYTHGRYASSAYWLGQHARCRVHFEKSLCLNNDISNVHRDYGHYLEHIQHRQYLAEKHYLKCLELCENDRDCRFYYANMLLKQQRYKEAQTQYQKAIDAPNTRLCVHLAFARCLKEMKKYKLSLKRYRVCLRLNPLNTAVLLEYGQLLCLEVGDYKEGLKHIRTSLNIRYRDETKLVLDRMERKYAAILEQQKQSKIKRETGRRETRGSTPNGTPRGTRGKVPVRINTNFEDDDDQKCESPQSSEETLKIAQRIRESEFERFMDFQSFLNDKVRGEYVAEFKRRKLNDIILLKIDTDAFVDELGIRNLLHSMLIKKRIDRFKREMDVFHDWLIRLRMEETVNQFEKYGILTFEQFDHHIKSDADLKWLLGNRMGKHAEIIWNANYLFRVRRSALDGDQGTGNRTNAECC